MEDIITVDGTQYVLTYDSPLTEEQRTQTISNIKKESGCGCGNKAAHLGGVYTLQEAYANINMFAPAYITVTDISVGGIDCPTGLCPDAICTSIGCATDTRNIVSRYTNSGDISIDIVPNLTVSKTATDINNAVRSGADRLIQTQKNDGTWQWYNPDTNPATTEYPGTNNTLGVTARGLVKAYMVTGNIAYLNSAKKTADLLVSKTPDGFGPDGAETTGKHKVYGQDITFLVEFADAMTLAGYDANSYYTKANDYMSLVINSPTRLCTGGCSGNTDQLVTYNHNPAPPGTPRTPNLYGWDIRGWVEAAVKTSNMAFAQSIVSSMLPYEGELSSTATGAYPTGSSYVLGLSGYLDSYIMTDKAPADYSSVSTKLLSELDTDGSFKIYDASFDGLRQTAAYALLALCPTNVDMTSTINYLINSQYPDGSGKWIESDGYEYPEVESEIIVALGTTVIPYIGASTTIPGRSSADITFNNVVLSRGPNHVCADWTPLP